MSLLISCCEEFSNHNHITFNINKLVILPIYFDKYYHNPVKLCIGNKHINVIKHINIVYIEFLRTYLMKLTYI